jgi:hypothetical protein
MFVASMTMSSNPDRFKNPLIRDGVSQRQRQASSLALSPDFAKLDEWELADALVFAYHLSQKIRYYGQDGDIAGNWTEFFNSTPIQIALISKTRPQTLKDKYNKQLRTFLDAAENGITPVLEFWKTDLLKTIQDWYGNLESYTPLKAAIKGLVKTNLEEVLIRIQSFEKGIGKESPFYSEFAQAFGLNLLNTVSIHAWMFDDDCSIHRDELDKVFQVLFQTYRQIIQLAPQYLKSSLSDRQDHPPHLALYFAFWSVMQPVRDDLNLMTQRHLEFFYRKVLCLSDRPAVPDRAHLLFELAKLPDLVEFKLPSGTRFKAGKDAIGKDLFYTLDQDVVVHKAKIVSLKGVFLDKQDNLIRGLHASTIANSFDGKGGEFPKEQVIQSWLPFGDRSRDTMMLGLAIASDGLLLKEGNRTITLTLTLRETRPEPISGVKGRFSDLTDAELLQLFKIKVSGKEKEWTAAKLVSVSRTSPVNLPNFTHQLTLTIELTADQSPLLPYRVDLPGAVLPTTKPVLLLLVNSSDADRIHNLAPYHFLRSLQLIDLTIETTVDQVRDLLLQNDLSVLDVSKPFQPFGPLPKPGSTLYIGSQEVFQKHLTELKIDLQLEQPKPANWLDIYAAYDPAEDATDPNQVSQNFEPGKLTIAALRARTWSDPVISSLFDASSLALTPELTKLNLDSALDSEAIAPWTPQSQHSFLRLQLWTGSPRSDFLHSEYPLVLARQMVAVATNTPITIQDPNSDPPVEKQKRTSVIGAYYRRKADQSIFKAKTYHDAELDDEPIIPKEPYLPVIQSLSIFYRAIVQKQDCVLFHLCPFDGFVELKTESPYLVMQFTDSGALHEGELLIGLQNLDPPTALPLLFQVVEESADALLKKALVQWFYLKDNTWHSLRDRIINDTTNGLVTSGIVHVGIPDDISNAQTTILDPTLHWIKASVTERSRAICQIINVHTQAAQVNFTDEENDPNHLAIPLAAGSIAALEVPLAEIKATEQPYASFGGRVRELPDHFYLRVSEQLRHKGRAVTIFDYERLVLEKFPEIYKVRCINHGLFDETQDHMHELVPGAVTLAVIPDLANCSTLHDLEPKVNINLLDKIKDYLTSLSSPWVEIKVVNPIYERIQIECRVKFKPPYDMNFGYYSRQLNLAITDFLAPWAGNRDAEIQFGSKLYYSTVLNFIEQQDYVDYIVDLKMNFAGQTNVREVIASTPRSVLTSGASTQNEPFHRILEFQETDIINLSPQRLLQPNRLGYIRLEELILE